MMEKMQWVNQEAVLNTTNLILSFHQKKFFQLARFLHKKTRNANTWLVSAQPGKPNDPNLSWTSKRAILFFYNQIGLLQWIVQSLKSGRQQYLQ